METVTIVASREPVFTSFGLMVVVATVIVVAAWLGITWLRGQRPRLPGSHG